MEEEMFAFFPNGIRALVVDDDPKFVKSAATMLSLLNFKGTFAFVSLWFSRFAVYVLGG